MTNATLTTRQKLKRLASTVGVESSASLWQGMAVAAYERKIRKNEGFRSWLESEGGKWVADHWGHEKTEGTFSHLHVASQIFEITETLRRRIGDPGLSAVLDAGASDGFFLHRIGANRGVGLNLLEACARKIDSNGYDASVADIERLPFSDGTFPIVICCETLEHVPNPVLTLNELARVCSGKIYMTIPWLPRTRLNAKPPGWPEVESHIFEFCERDFARILTHADVRVAYRSRVQVFPEPSNPATQAWLRLLMYPSFFPKLQYYELEPLRR